MNTGPQFSDPEPRIRHMAKYGVNIQGICLGGLTHIGAQFKNALSIYKVGNEAVAEIAEKYHDRFVGLATLPTIAEEALDELKRDIEDLGLRGVQIYSNIGGEPIDSPKFRAFFDTVTKYDVPILLHPAEWEYTPWIREYYLLWIFGWPFDTTLAMGRLAFSGMMEKYPDLKIVTHHLGAMVPYFAERISCIYDAGQEYPFLSTGSKTKKPVIDSFRRFYNDTAIYGWKPGVQLAYSFFGPDHIVFGSDYPFGPEGGDRFVRNGLTSVNELRIPKKDKSKILELNARKLLKI